MAVNLEDGAVDYGAFHVGLCRYGVDHALEDIALDPVAEALEDCVPGAEVLRQVAPGRPRPRDPQHRLHKSLPAAAGAPRIGLLAPTVRPIKAYCPSVRANRTIPQSPSFGELESQSKQMNIQILSKPWSARTPLATRNHYRLDRQTAPMRSSILSAVPSASVQRPSLKR